MGTEDEPTSSGMQERIEHRQANRAFQARHSDQRNSNSSALRNDPRDANPPAPSNHRASTSNERGYNIGGNPNPPKKSKPALNASKFTPK